MARQIFAWILIVLSAIFLLLSVIGIGAAWFYNKPLKNEAASRLNEIDQELDQAQVTLESTQTELERALRIVNDADTALDKMFQQSNQADNIFDSIKVTLDDKLLPELKLTRTRIVNARASLESFQSVLEGFANFIPGLDLSGPDKVLADLISSATSIDNEISNVEEIAKQASTFVGDTSYLLGGDLTETRDSLEGFLTAVQEYQEKVTGWRTQVSDLNRDVPIWIDRTTVGLTVFLLWFGLSQFGLLLHGLNIRRGVDPFAVLRPMPVEEDVIA